MVDPTSVADWAGLGAAALLVARVAKAARPGRQGWIVAAAALVICFVPVEGIAVGAYVRGHIGDLSVSSVVLLIYSFVGPLPLAQRRAAAVTFSVAAAGLYPMALGLGPIDPYRFGYAPLGLLAAVLALGVVAMVRGWNVLVVCLAAALAGYGLGLLESANLWDYLLDPWLAILSVVELSRRLAARGKAVAA